MHPWFARLTVCCAVVAVCLGLAGCSQSGATAHAADVPGAAQDVVVALDAGPDALVATDVPDTAAVADVADAAFVPDVPDVPAVPDVADAAPAPDATDVADGVAEEVAETPDVADASPADLGPDAADVAAQDVALAADAVDAGPACVVGAAELCDGLDNNCDGQTDEAACDDGNDCTGDACQPAAGGKFACTHTLLADVTCSDGDACTVGDKCVTAVCIAGVAKVCDDDNACTDDSCDTSSGKCGFLPNTVPCQDGNACTAGDACSGGSCQGGAYTCACSLGNAATACNDENDCTTDSCVQQGDIWVCQHEALTGTACSDGNACTKNDVCATGVCGGTSYTCAAAGVCQMAGVCQGDGTCTFADLPDATTCSDDNACTKDDQCTAGVCSGTTYSCAATDPCHKAGACLGDGTCLPFNQPDSTPCDDGNGCTRTDTCLGGVCVGANPTICTPDACHDAGVCIPALGTCSSPAKNDGIVCDDGDPCTTVDACKGGSCNGSGALGCDDGNVCTTDSCVALQGCKHVAVADGGACTDGTACTTGDSCQAGVCTGTIVACGDGNPCTVDACDPATGCSHTAGNDGAACDDKTDCTKSDTCSGGICSGTAYACAEPDGCHVAGVCVGDGSCTFANKTDATPCNDGNLCTSGENCKSGTCQGGTAYVCTASQCQSTSVCDGNGGCSISSKANGAACNDGEPCTASDVCSSGVCVGTGVPNCDDSNFCTNDFCTPGIGCQHSNVGNGTACSDGNACTQVDTCQSGVCTGASPVVCVAKDQCHDIGTCDPLSGACANPAKNDGATCNDGQACTKTDVCTGGVCGGTSYTCPAADACHQAGVCAGDGSCTFANKSNGTACDDGVACTKSDVCTAGVCGGTPYTCSSPNECQTNVACDGTGCAISAKSDGTPCTDDGTLCTTDQCLGGACSHTVLNCDDGNGCTADTCYYALGCLHNYDAAQQSYFKSAGAKELGTSVAVDGDTAVVGSPGAEKVVVFVRSGATWTQQQALTAGNAAVGDRFGQAVGISGNTIIVGAPFEDSNSAAAPANDGSIDSGAAYVFVRVGTTWTQQQYLKASNISPGDHFGTAVAVSGDLAIVGAPYEAALAVGVNPAGDNESYPGAGAAYTFARTGSAWAQEARIKASNDYYYWYFGSSVAIDGTTAVVGAPGEGSTGVGVNGVKTGPYTAYSSGAAWVYLRTGPGAWTNQANMKAPINHNGDNFGAAVAIMGQGIVIGAPPANKAYVYGRSGAVWSLGGALAPPVADAGDGFGTSVAFDNNLAVVGAPFEDGGSKGVDGIQADNSLSASGAVYLFESSVGWNLKAYLKASNPGGGSALNPNNGDRFGSAVAVSGLYPYTVLVGAPLEASNATTVDGNQNDNSSPNAGAAYVFLTASYATCDDGNLCTDDGRSGGTCACQHLNNTTPCSNTDNNTCTDDFCGGGSCATHKPNDANACTDGNPCTDDGCAAGVCKTVAMNTAPCSDNNACTVGDICDGTGKCKAGGGALSCPGCQTCDPTAGCVSDACCTDPVCCGDFCCQNPSDCSCDPCCSDPCGPICNGC